MTAQCRQRHTLRRCTARCLAVRLYLRRAPPPVLQVKKDLLELKDKITTTEVSIARIYNYDVVRRRALSNAAAVA